MRAEEPRPIRLADYRPPDFLIDRVDLSFNLQPNATGVTAKLSMRPNPAGQAGAPLVLDGDELVLEDLKLDGEALGGNAYTADPQTLTIAVPPQQPFLLEITTRLDPAANTKLMGLYRTSGNYCTQCEAEGFRRITYFLDRPDVLAIYTTRIEADRGEAPVLLANGNLVEAGPVPGTNRHFAVWHDPFPKPSYLFALVGGDLGLVQDSFTTESGRHVDLRIYVEHGKQRRAVYAMDALKRSMRWDEKVFGREYDLDIFMIVAVSDFNMGAMENKGLNVFNDRYVLASPQTATDGDYAGIEAVIAHEYFHNWTGNRITCRDWFQLCLKEGLTVFRDQEFSSDERSRAVKRIADVRLLRAQQFPEDAGPLAHPVRPQIYHEINNFYTATVYEKGAEVIRMLKVLIGADAFRRGMDLYFERHDGQAATVEDFIACFADTSGRDLSQFMLWYVQSGTPEVGAATSYDAATRRLSIEFSQSLPPTPGQPVKTPMLIPVALALIGEDGKEMPIRTSTPLSNGVLALSEPLQTVAFEDVDGPSVPSLLRGFSAPVKLTTNLEDSELLFLAAHDTDPFGRWQAMQTYSTRFLLRSVAAVRSGERLAPEHALVEAVGAAFADESLEPAFAAQLVALPSESDLARDLAANVDPDAVRTAREDLRRALSRELAPILERRWKQLAGGDYSPDAASAGRRALRNAALDLRCAASEPDGLKLATQQYDRADNMTDRLAALAVIAVYDDAAREPALADFYARFEADPLVIDKWLGLQATIPEPTTIERVRNLMAHSAFSMSNPNRVRSLFGSFAVGNPTQFNRPDGAGFDLVCEVVLTLDARNPQVAARLLAAFKTWQVLEPGRRAKAETALRRVAAKEGLSPDVGDIARRALDGLK